MVRPGVSPALKRTESSLTQAVPGAPPTVSRSWPTDRVRPEGEASLSRTGTVTTSPTRTTAVSGTATGTCTCPAETGTTATRPMDVGSPLETVYSMSRLCDRGPAEVICSRQWSTTVTLTPDSAGAVADCRTRMPPVGSKSLLSGAIVTAPPSRSRAVSFSATGGTEASAGSTTSMRTMPLATAAPAATS